MNSWHLLALLSLEVEKEMHYLQYLWGKEKNKLDVIISGGNTDKSYKCNTVLWRPGKQILKFTQGNLSIWWDY